MYWMSFHNHVLLPAHSMHGSGGVVTLTALYGGCYHI